MPRYGDDAAPCTRTRVVVRAGAGTMRCGRRICTAGARRITVMEDDPKIRVSAQNTAVAQQLQQYIRRTTTTAQHNLDALGAAADALRFAIDALSPALAAAPDAVGI